MVIKLNKSRIRLLFTANGNLMGSEVHAADSKVRFVISVTGEAQLKSVVLLCNKEPWRTYSMLGQKLEVVEEVLSCPPSNWYVRVTQVDNHIAYSSPVWIV